MNIKSNTVVAPKSEEAQKSVMKTRMDLVIKGLEKSANGEKVTTSSKIRALAASGEKTGDIARYLDKRYQHVRNVLIVPLKTK